MQRDRYRCARKRRLATRPPQHPLARPAGAPATLVVIVVITVVAVGHWEPAAVLALLGLLLKVPEASKRTAA